MSARKRRLLLSARDAGSLGHVQAILEQALRDPMLEVSVYADDPAWEPLSREHAFVHRFGMRAMAQPTAEYGARLVAEARRIIELEQPDAVLVGVSHFHEIGVDEALLAAAHDRPRFAMQDFWGDANLSLGAGADLYFALDEAAVRLTASRHGLAARACGSPKHARYASLDVLALREQARAELGVAADRPLVGYFGQALSRLPGYGATVQAFAQAFTALEGDAGLFYKAHPRESEAEIGLTLAAFAAAGIAARQVHGATEKWLAAADATVCCFSSCAYDATFLYRASPVPIGSAVYLLFEDTITHYFRSVSGLDLPPPAELGLVGCVTRREALRATLQEALSPQGREASWRAAREQLPDPKGAAQAMLAEIAARMAQA